MKVYEILELMDNSTPITIYNGYDRIIFSNFLEEIFLMTKIELKLINQKTVRAIFLDGEKEEIAIYTNE